MDQVTDYYVNQAQTGLSGFQGSRYQKGGGIFSWLAKLGLPVLKFLGKQAVSTGLNVASDVLDGRNWKESTKDHLKQTGRNTVRYAADKLSGSGRKRKRSRKNPMSTKKRKTSQSIKKRRSTKKRPVTRKRWANKQQFIF